MKRVMSSKQRSQEYSPRDTHYTADTDSTISTSGKSGEPKRHGLVSFLACTAVAVLAIFIAYSIISDNIKIREYSEQYKSLVEQTNSTLEENAQINRYLEDDANLDEYIEDIAREKLDFANPDERIYYIVPSSG